MWTLCPTVRPYIAWNGGGATSVKRRVVWEGSGGDDGCFLVNTGFPRAAWVYADDGIEPHVRIGSHAADVMGEYDGRPVYGADLSGSSGAYLFHSKTYGWIVSDFLMEPLEYTWTDDDGDTHWGGTEFYAGTPPALSATDGTPFSSVFQPRGLLKETTPDGALSVSVSWSAETLQGGSALYPPTGDFDGCAVGYRAWGAGGEAALVAVGGTVYRGTSGTRELAREGGSYVLKRDADGAWTSGTIPSSGTAWTFSYAYASGHSGDAKADIVLPYAGRVFRTEPDGDDGPRYVFPTARFV